VTSSWTRSYRPNGTGRRLGPGDRDRFALLLAELVELSSRDRLLVAHTGDGKLATGELVITVERQ
jgi:hypothetical protein